MAEVFDDLHYNTLTIDGYQKPFNAIISEREDGKTTWIWIKKVYKAFKEEGRPSLVIRRLINDITETYINDIAEVINKFNDDKITFQFKKGSFKEGIVDIRVNDTIFLRVVALSNPMSRIKSLILRNIKYIVFDEFICNQRMKESYLSDEAFRFKEIYNTFQRETTNLKCYFLGNPYSLYNPYFVDWGVDTRQLKRGAILTGKNWVIECHELNPLLREKILAKNPLYQFDDSYTRYAFNGLNINDSNIRIAEQPKVGYALRFAFHINDKNIGIYENLDYNNDDQRFWCGYVDSISARKKTYCFEFNDLIDRTILVTREDKFYFSTFKRAFNNRLIEYEDIACYYLIESIYVNL